MILKFLMKIAYFAFSEEYGAKHAGFTHTYNMAKALGNLNLDINVFLYSSKKIDDKDFFAVQFPNLRNIFRINPLNYLRSYFLVKKNILDVDLIHERFHINPVELLFFNRNKPYVLEINDPAMILHDNIFYKSLINLKLKRCSAIITQTQTLKNILSRYTSKPIYVVANGVDTNQFNSNIITNLREIYSIKRNEIVVIFVGAFMQWHGVQEIIKLASLFKNYKFMMVGSGPEFDYVCSKAKNLNNLIIVGPKSSQEIPKFVAASDIAIAPFNTEKFDKLDKFGFWWCPVKLFEYMASGKAVLSYDYGEVRNIVKDAGLLAKVGNFDDLCDKLKKLGNNKKQRLIFGKKGRSYALRYDWKYRAKEVYEVYEKCLKN